MALVAPVENGKIVETASHTSVSKAAKSSSGMDKEAFLQLLVAQMKYQDPLEPTSNTEYIALFSMHSSHRLSNCRICSNSIDFCIKNFLVIEVFINNSPTYLQRSISPGWRDIIPEVVGA